MKQRRHGLDGLGQTKGLHALEEVLARASTLVQRGLRPRELQVLACPLLHQGRGKGEAEEPENVDADGGRGRAEGRVAVERWGEGSGCRRRARRAVAISGLAGGRLQRWNRRTDACSSC